MFKKLFSFLLAFMGISSLFAAGLPQVSTEGNEVWYLIQFGNGGSVFHAAQNNANITTASMNGEDAQFWKFEGNERGYTITNKLGYVLCSSNNQQNTMVKASDSPSGTKKFKIIPTKHSGYKGSFEIVPVGNNGVSMNLFGGPGANNGVGYWTNSQPDPNNCVKFLSQKEYETVGKFAIIPYPRSLTVVKDGGLALNEIKTISCPEPAMETHLQQFVEQLKLVSGIELQVVMGEGNADKAIQMLVDAHLPAEGYTLNVNDHGVTIKAAQFAGFFYALQTLKQMLPNVYFENRLNTEVAWELPYLDIVDEPNLEHRGFMLDVGRHFFDANEVKRVIDVMSLYKMNIFHWHLTEDQGWRIEIPEYPKLTEVGSIRKGSFSNPGEDGQFFDDTEYGRGMWYTQKELKEVVAYAKERNIEIVPEVDFPGHMVSAIAAYPELSCDPNKQYEVRVPSGVSKDILNVGNDKVIDFLKTIMDNLAQIFPYEYIHFGGDECPVDQWRDNPDCLKRVRDNNLKGVEELQSWLIEELGTYVKEKYHKNIIVWDDFMAHWNPSYKIKPVVMCWLGKNRMAAEKGLKSIACSTDYTYLDMMQVSEKDALIDEPYRGGWGGKVSTVEKIYNFNPYGNLNGMEEYAYGTQANMWTETTNDNFEMEYQVFPRLLAFSEVGWLPVSEKNWSSFHKRLQSHDEILDAFDINYAKHYIVPEELTANEAVIVEAEEILSQSIRGGVGYPEETVYDALTAALEKAKSDETAVEALKDALQTYKTAAIVQPQAGKYYQIFSASTYSKKQFAGSSLYQSDDKLRIHYTPQVEPEELWEFVPADEGYFLQNVGSHKMVALRLLGRNAYIADKGIALRVDKATIATKNYTYIPGVVTISNVSGYKEVETGKVKRLVAQVSGFVNAEDDAALCYPGTWKIVEVTDFNAQLEGLCRKCESILRDNDVHTVGHRSAEAVEFLTTEVLDPAKEEMGGVVTEQTYLKYLDKYNEFLAMPRVTVLEALDEGVYYHIQNVYFSNYYAAVNGENVTVRRLDKNDSQFFWQLEKNENGSIYLKNKGNGRYACATDAAQQAPVVFKDEKEAKAVWVPELIKTDQNQSGIAITDATNVYSWYAWAQGGEFANVDFRPKDWGASIWNFVKTNQVVTGIDNLQTDDVKVSYYDLSGRKVSKPARGLYIKSNGEKIYVE